MTHVNFPKIKTIKTVPAYQAALQSDGHIENTTKEDNEFEPGINEPHERVVDDEQLMALPENEEEKEEILLPSTTAAKPTK